MTLAQLRTFVAIARLGSYKAAATKLSMTQPTLSLRIQSLEDDLRVRLFERSGHNVQLSIDGLRLLTYAERILTLSDELRANAISKSLFDGVLRLGAIDSFAVTWLPKILFRLKREFPRLKVDLTVDHSVHLMRKLNESELDLAFLVNPTVDEHIVAVPICQLDYTWVASPKMSFSQSELSPRDLVDIPIITVPKPSRSYDLCLKWFSADDLEPQRLNFCNSLAMIIPLVAAGFGVAALPRCLVEEHLRNGILRELVVLPKFDSNTLSVALRADKSDSGVGAIVSIVKQIVNGEIESNESSFQAATKLGEKHPIFPQ